MPAITTAQLEALPAILLLGARQSGKTQTITSWSALFNLFTRDEAGNLVPEYRQQADGYRSYEIVEYIVEIDGTHFRLFDVPGEVLETPAATVPNQVTGAQMFVRTLLGLRPRVVGVIAIATPPSGAGGVGWIADTAQVQADGGRAIGEDNAVKQLRAVLEMVQTVVEQRLARPGDPAPAVVVQIGFADLVAWPEGIDPLFKLHASLRAGSAARLTREGLGERAPVFAGLDELSNKTFGWLEAVRREVPGFAFRSVPACNRHGRPNSLPRHNVGASLLCLVDEIQRPRVEAERRAEQARKTRRRVLTFTGALVFALVATLGGLAALAFRAPEVLPGPVAVAACTHLGKPEDHCGCAEVLAGQGAGVSFRERFDLIAPYTTQCRQSLLYPESSRRSQTMGLAAQVELARGILAPAEFDLARYEAALKSGGQPGSLRGPMPWYPASSPAQVQAVQMLQALAAGEQAIESVKPAEAVAAGDRAEFGAMLKVLAGAKKTATCLGDWQRARESGNWKAPAASCGREGERLPAELQPCFRADAALGFADASLAPAPPPLCGSENACSRGTGLEGLLLRAPKPDPFTFANLAARAGSAEELSQCIGRARGAIPPHLFLLRLLGPARYEDRQALVRAAEDGQFAGVAELLRREWVVAEAGRHVGATARGRAAPARLPMLPLRHAVEAACALVEVPALYAPPASPLPWREGLEVDPLAAESPLTHRARAALALLAAAGDMRTPQSAGCELTAAVALLRLPPGPEHAALQGRVNAVLQMFESARAAPEAAVTLAASARLRCRLQRLFARSAVDSPDILECAVPAADAGVAGTPATPPAR